MRARWLCAAALVSAAAASLASGPQLSAQDSAPEEAQAEPYQGAIIRRWSPVVSDMDRAIELYRDILGFELARLYEDPPESYVFEIYGIKRGTKTRHAVFHAGEDKRVLSVVEVPGLKQSRSDESPRMSALLVSANGRFDEIVAMLRERDYTLLSPQRLGSNGIELGFIDHDGHLYALYEIPYGGEIKLGD